MYLNFDSKLGKFSKSTRNFDEAIYGFSEPNQNNDMQSIDLSGNFPDNTDRSNVCGSSECRITDSGMDLHRQILELNQTVADLRNTIQTKDLRISNIHRDNERLASELKKQQRCNRNLKQQLDDERLFYEKEKEHFCQEMQSHKARCLGTTTKVQQQQRRESQKIRECLENENKQLRNDLMEKSQVTYNLCIKFLRMKDARDSLRQKLDNLLQEHLQVMAEMMEKLDEAREELNIIVSEKFQDPLPISKAKFLQIVQRNSRLVYENSTLKLHIQQLTQNIERLKSTAQKTKTINVDARTIEKLIECSRKRRNDGASRISSSLSRSTKLDKSLSVSKSTSPINSSIDERSLGDVKMISMIKTKNRSKLTIPNPQKLQEITPSEVPTERTQSAPEIVQSSTFRQAIYSETPTNITEFTERSIDIRDIGTNT